MRTCKLLSILTAATLLPMLASAGDLAAMIRSGDRQAALSAIRDGANVNTLQNDGSSPLLWAVYKVDYELVEALLKKGAKPDLANVLGATPLNEAITLADEKMAFMLLKAGANPNLGNADDETPLMLAARVSSLPIAQALVKAGAKVNQREKYRNQSALMWAVDARSPAITDLLIQHKADVDFRAAENDWGNQITSEPRAQYRDSGGLTPLLYAARSGCVECIKSLVKAGANIDRPTPDGVTPLMTAIDNSNFSAANTLLDLGANPKLFDWWSRTAVYLAADMRTRGGAVRSPSGFRNNDTNYVPEPPQATALQVLQRLLEMGVDPNTQLDTHRPLPRPLRGRPDDHGVHAAAACRAVGGQGCRRAAAAAWRAARPAQCDGRDAADGRRRHRLRSRQGAQRRSAARCRPAGLCHRHHRAAAEGRRRHQRAHHRYQQPHRRDRAAEFDDRSPGPDRAVRAPSATTGRRSRPISSTTARAFDVKDDHGKTLVDGLTGLAGGRDTTEDRRDPAPDELVKLVKGGAGSAGS